jgi:hypothetical protein
VRPLTRAGRTGPRQHPEQDDRDADHDGARPDRIRVAGEERLRRSEQHRREHEAGDRAPGEEDGEERARDGGGAEVRVDPLDRAEERAGRAREGGADDERDLARPHGVDPVAARERLVRHHRAHRQPDPGEADEHAEPEDDPGAEQDQQQPVGRVLGAEHRARARRRQVEEAVARAVDERDALDDDERDAPGGEDRVERPRVEAPDDDDLDERPDRAGDERREQDARPERDAVPAEADLRVHPHGHQPRVREVDDVEESEDQEEADDDEDERADPEQRVESEAHQPSFVAPVLWSCLSGTPRSPGPG